MAFSLTPVLDHIVLRVGKRHGDLWVPPTVPTPGPAYAEVVAVGPGRPSEYSGDMIYAPPLETGDTVLFHGGAGTKVEVDGEEYLFIKPADLLAVK